MKTVMHFFQDSLRIESKIKSIKYKEHFAEWKDSTHLKIKGYLLSWMFSWRTSIEPYIAQKVLYILLKINIKNIYK